MECADLPSAMIWQYVYLPSCGVRCRRWSAKNLWNAKNSEYAWLVSRPHREISGPEPKFQSQSQPKLPGAHHWVLFFRVHLGWGPGEETGPWGSRDWFFSIRLIFSIIIELFSIRIENQKLLKKNQYRFQSGLKNIFNNYWKRSGKIQ